MGANVAKLVDGVKDATKTLSETGDALKSSEGVEKAAETAKAVGGAAKKVGGAAIKGGEFVADHGKGLAALGGLGVGAYALSSPEAARNVGAAVSNTAGGLVNGVLTGSSADQAAGTDVGQASQQAGGGLIGGINQVMASAGKALSQDGAASLVMPALAVGAGALILGKSGGLGSLAKTAAVAVGGIALFEAAKNSGIFDQVSHDIEGQQVQGGQPAQASQRQLADYDGPDDADASGQLEMA